MKRLLSITIIIIIAIGYLVFKMHSYYAPPTEKQPYLIQQKHDDTLRIAYIGDSWAFMHKEHNCQIPKILEDSLHVPIKVHSYGICGQTSKEFYESLFNNSDLKCFMVKRNYDYCLISLGINDTYKKMSTDYYQQSMSNLLRFLLSNNIYPILLEIPDYDIYKAYERQKLSRKLLRIISMSINNTPVDCKQLFRNALDNMIIENNYSDLLGIIRYKVWNDNKTKDLNTLFLNDGMHLNEKGYSKLDSCISDICIRKYRLNKR